MNIGIHTIFRTKIEWQIRKNAWEYPHLGSESPITARLLNAKNYKS